MVIEQYNFDPRFLQYNVNISIHLNITKTRGHTILATILNQDLANTSKTHVFEFHTMIET